MNHNRKVRTARIAQRRDKVASMYLSSRTQSEIAEAVGVTQRTVSNDLSALQKQWQINAVQSFDKVKAKELAAIDRLEREYWTSWLASQAPKETTGAEQSTGESVRTKTSVRTQQRDGDPRFLEGVRWCIQKRCDIMGLNAATKQMNLTKDLSQLTDAELDKELAKYGIAT